MPTFQLPPLPHGVGSLAQRRTNSDANPIDQPPPAEIINWSIRIGRIMFQRVSSELVLLAPGLL